MPRNFQFYVKKRRGRRTGSPAIGSLALAIFFALFLIVGIGFFAALVVKLIIPEWRAQHRFLESRAVVLRTGVRPASANDATIFRPEVLIRYDIDGRSYQTWTYDVARVESGNRAAIEALLEKFVVDHEYPCWYDPEDPNRAVLVRGYSWSAWLMTLLPLSLVVVGGGGLTISLLNWGKSVERRAAMAQMTKHLELFEPAAPADRNYPSLPPENQLINSPGTTLKFRLPLDTAPGRALAILVGVVIGLLVGTAFFAFQAVQGHVRGEPDWFMTIFAAVWAIAALVAFGFVIRSLVRDAGVGTTIVEVSDHPWRPGEHYELFLAQGGRQDLTKFDVRLICEEKATYSQGTNTRTELAVAIDEHLFQREGSDSGGSQPFEARCEVAVPARAMHSFSAEHNEIAWRLVVAGESAKRGAFVRSFPILVYPAREGGGSM